MSAHIDSFMANRTLRMKGSAIREFFKLAEQKDMISFAGGFPSAAYFPLGQIKNMLNESMLGEEQSFLQYSPTEGITRLRRCILNNMEQQGIEAEEKNMLITSGSQQGLDLICKLLVDTGDIVIVEEPGYVGCLEAINNYEGALVSIPLDEQGIRTDVLEQYLQERAEHANKVKFLYIVPNFQNPTGITLSLARRKRLLSLASQYDFLIVEDNPYGELRYEGEDLFSLKHLDNEERVIYLGSFSKIFIPGIRVGWVVAPEKIIDKMVAAKQAMDLCSNTLGQYLALKFCLGGHLEPHINQLRKKYKRKRNLMLEAMSHYFPPEVSWTKPEGGFFIWATFPLSVDARSLLLKALEKRTAFVDGRGFFAGCNGHNTGRFSFSEAGESEIHTGIKRIGELLHS